MKLQPARRRQTEMPVQLELFDWSSGSPRPNAGAKAGYYGNGHRQRPSNDDDPFSQARGYVPPRGRSRWKYAENVDRER
jgi:hypothetical protein